MTYTSKNRTAYFQIRDKMQRDYSHAVLYHGTYPETHSLEDYVGEPAHKISERAIVHSGRETNSHLNIILTRD